MMGTWIVGTVLLCVIAAIIYKMIRDKKNGKCVGCDSCPCSGECHKDNSL